MSTPDPFETDYDNGDHEPVIINDWESTDVPETVTLIASGYEWMCPKCDTLNNEIETHDTVTCRHCGASWIVDTDILHADG